MESRSHALMAGFFTIALLILATVFAIWLGRDKIQRSPYEIATKLGVPGLNLQAAVRYKGIKVGNVTDIDFDPKVPGQILLRIEVTPDTPVTTTTFATLGYQGVTGIAFIDLDDDEQSPQTLTASASQVQNNTLPRIPLRPGLMQNLEQRGMAILKQTEQLTTNLNALLGEDNRRSLRAAITHIDQAASAWEALPEKLNPTVNQLPALVQQTQATMDSFKTLSANASQLTANLNGLTSKLQANDGPLVRFNQALDRVSNDLTLETLPRIHALTGDARNSLHSLNRTSELIGERPQSILFGNPAPAPGPGEPGFTAPK
ncbi:MAG: MCE family protein [Burkholderiales bacterium]|nr:MCE family protein [Burkholderiales bacterium]